MHFFSLPKISLRDHRVFGAPPAVSQQTPYGLQSAVQTPCWRPLVYDILGPRNLTDTCIFFNLASQWLWCQ